MLCSCLSTVWYCPFWSICCVYLQNVEGVRSDAQSVKDAHYFLPTPDFTGSLIAPLRHQALALLDPAGVTIKRHPECACSLALGHAER